MSRRIASTVGANALRKRNAMRITDVTLTIFRWAGIPPVRYGTQNPTATRSARIGLLAIETDAGVVGHAFLGSSFRPVDLDARAVIDVIKPLLVGQDPLDRERMSRAMLNAARAIMLCRSARRTSRCGISAARSPVSRCTACSARIAIASPPMRVRRRCRRPRPTPRRRWR